MPSYAHKRRAHDTEGSASKGLTAAKKVLYARALLLLDEREFGDAKRKVDAVATAVGLSDRTLERLENRVVGDGLDGSLERMEREAPPRKISFGGEFETQLVKLACPVAPDGRSRWTVRLLGDKLTEPKIVDTVSTMTVHNTLKNELIASYSGTQWTNGMRMDLVRTDVRSFKVPKSTLRRPPVPTP